VLQSTDDLPLCKKALHLSLLKTRSFICVVLSILTDLIDVVLPTLTDFIGVVLSILIDLIDVVLPTLTDFIGVVLSILIDFYMCCFVFPA
jgi:hypothetical protein